MDVTEFLRERLRRTATVRTDDAESIPIATVSGVATTTTGMIRWFDLHTAVSVITTKSFQLSSNEGYPEPILLQATADCFINAVGLRNPGIDTAVLELTALRRESPLGALLNISLSGKDVGEFTALASRAAGIADILELNYSCPHASDGYGADIGRDVHRVTEITEAVVRTVPDVPILVKLPPDVPDIATLGAAAVRAGAAGIAAINTVGPIIPRLYSEEVPAFSNPRGGRGGKSGRWVFAVGCEAVTALRRAVGKKPVIFGMGGVNTLGDAMTLRQAGADVVGIGSVLATLHQRNWRGFIDSLGRPRQNNWTVSESPKPPAVADDFGYRRMTVHTRRELGDDMFELELEDVRDRTCDPEPAGPGQTIFLRLSGVGEKPFTTAIGDPRTFLIRRRGAFTHALGKLDRGDTLHMRGPYGDRHFPDRNSRGLLVAGGSGVAALPAIAEAIMAREGTVTTLAGFRSPISPGAVEGALAGFGPCKFVSDDDNGGVLARISRTAFEFRPTVCYIVGPEGFMETVVSIIRQTYSAEGRSRDVPSVPGVFLSLERSTRCGIGMCGECHHGGLLTCQYGTIVTAEEFLNG